MNIISLAKQFWDFLWNDDSALSWVLNIMVAFLVIKFLVYPGLGLVFGTQFPIVAVVSGSMEHDGTFDRWWASPAICERYCTQEQFYAGVDITKERFTTFDFPNGFNTGDIMILVGTPAQHLQVGDIVVFFSAAGEPIIHRIITKKDDPYLFRTKGDHNTASIVTPGLNEIDIPQDKIIGKAVIRIPYLGYVKIVFFSVISKIGMIFKSLF
jgi:signal peptidase I